MQPFIDSANYNRGLWVREAIALLAFTGGLEGMSVWHGLKEGGESPFGVAHMAGNVAEWVANDVSEITITKVPRGTRPVL
jgi:formylglycine-generating enzyme required for sulfatase activity